MSRSWIGGRNLFRPCDDSQNVLPSSWRTSLSVSPLSWPEIAGRCQWRARMSPARRPRDRIVDRSTTGANWMDRVDGPAFQGTRRTQTDENHHLANVRVAGSNPVFRSAVFRSNERWGRSAV
jgi:hypothetical protein